MWEKLGIGGCQGVSKLRLEGPGARHCSPVQIRIQRRTENPCSTPHRRLSVIRRTPRKSESRFELAPGMVFPGYAFREIRIGDIP